ncbi:hypothetical protein SANTM175S_10043 [Streptomyces antimycoticus]
MPACLPDAGGPVGPLTSVAPSGHPASAAGAVARRWKPLGSRPGPGWPGPELLHRHQHHRAVGMVECRVGDRAELHAEAGGSPVDGEYQDVGRS